MQSTVNTTNIQTFATNINVDVLNRKFIFDISDSVFNNSPAGFGVKVAFSVVDSGGVVLSAIDWNNPQIPDASVAQTYELDLSGIVDYFFLFQSYRIIAAANDNGDIVYLDFPIKDICQPKGFTDEGYVEGKMLLKVDCTNNYLSVTDVTNFTYDGAEPYETVTDGTLYYPQGTKPNVNFVFTPFTDTNIYTGTYKIDNTTTALYDLGDGVTVSIAYSTVFEDSFNCEKAMTNLMCCIVDFQTEMEKHCGDALGASMKERWNNASIPFLTGILKEMNGEDATEYATQVKKILRCNCNKKTIKKVQPNAAPTAYNILVTGTGGTTVVPDIAGSTKNFIVNSKIYSITKQDPSDTAFTIYPADISTPNNVKYPIGFDYNVMAATIYTATAGNSTLLTQFNSLVNNLGIDLSNVNGSCVIDLSSTNYFLTQRLASAASEVVNIIIGSTTYTAPPSLLVTNTSGIEAWLDGLSLGTYDVSFSQGTTGSYINVLSVGNANTLVSMTFTTPTGSVTQIFQKTNKSIAAVLQAIIYYLCELVASQIQLGDTIDLCYIDYNGSVVNQSFSSTSTQAQLNTGVANALCQITGAIQTLNAVTCSTIQNLFNAYPNTNFSSSDSFLAIVGGNCTLLSLKQLGLAVISSVNSYQDVKTAFCAINCSTPATCPEITANNISMSGNDIGVYGVTWGTTPTAAQTVTVRYKLASSSTWITSTNSLSIFPNGNINGTTPYLITGISQGVIYDIWVLNNCGGAGFVSQITTPTNSIYSDDYYLNSVIYDVCASTPTTLYSSVPFAVGVTLYTNAGLTIPITGFDYVSPSTTGTIYNLNTSTGVVGSSTGLSCINGFSGLYILGNDSGTICTGTPQTLYTSVAPIAGVLAEGSSVYIDASLSTLATGYTYIFSVLANVIYNFASGIVGTTTGLSCTGVVIEVGLGNSPASVCILDTAAYTPNGYSFVVGDVIYLDAAMTTVVTGYTYISAGGNIFTINPATGQITSDTMVAC